MQMQVRDDHRGLTRRLRIACAVILYADFFLTFVPFVVNGKPAP